MMWNLRTSNLFSHFAQMNPQTIVFGDPGCGPKKGTCASGALKNLNIVIAYVFMTAVRRQDPGQRPRAVTDCVLKGFWSLVYNCGERTGCSCGRSVNNLLQVLTLHATTEIHKPEQRPL